MSYSPRRELTHWGKPYPSRTLAMLGPVSAYMADPLHWLLSSRDGKRLQERSTRQHASWDHYYESHLAVFADLPNEFLDIDQARKDRLSEVVEGGGFTARDAVLLPFLKRKHQVEAVEEALGFSQRDVEETIDMLVDDQGKGALPEAETRRLLENDAFRFVLRLVLPSFALHYQTPQGLAQRATDASQPDLDSMQAIYAQDPEYLASDQAKAVLFRGGDPEEINERLRVVTYDPNRLPQPPTLREIKHRMAGFVSYIAELFEVRIVGPDIRTLFNIRAKQLGTRLSYDVHIPDRENTLGTMIRRQRAKWRKLYDPDTNFNSSVRALWGRAA